MKWLLSLFTGGWIAPVLGALGLAAALWAGYAYIVHAARAEGRAEVQALWDKDTQAREVLAAAAAEEKRVKEAQHAQDIATERKNRERDAVVVRTIRHSADGTFNGLRDTSAAVSTSIVSACKDTATGSSIDAAAEASRSVFDECSGRRLEVAGDAEQLAAQVRGLQAWADSALRVCGE